MAFKIPSAENVPTALILCFLLVSLGLPEMTVICASASSLRIASIMAQSIASSPALPKP